jgi:glycosyltransferase involved in cell wall biosynthesis
MPDLSVIIPGRQEQFFSQTVENVLANIRGDSEVIAVCDGSWPDPVLKDHPRLKVIHHTQAVGQRAATNDGARLSRARFVMKLDAHCGVSKGFDVQLMKDHEPGMTQIPLQYNLLAFEWECQKCGNLTYQGVKPSKCVKCEHGEFTMQIRWRPQRAKKTVLWRFDKELHFQYWRGKSGQERVKNSGDMIETMSFIGACMFLERDRFWELGGMDETHGSWGQFGTEWACKTWLSGGRLVTNTRCWFAHMFRTGNFAAPGRSTWPYPITQGEIDRAREYSKNLWRSNTWPKAIHPLEWLVEKFRPVPDWHTEADPADAPKQDDGPVNSEK